eukprot:scaffold521_cov50-Cyclotella_meneghiniana.AAC.3
MTTYILLGDGEELTAVNLHNHFVEEAKPKSLSVSASTLDRFFGPGPVATSKSAGSQLSSSSSTTADLIPSFKTQFWLVEQPWYDERWVLRPDLINNYSLCGDIDSVSSDLTKEFDLNLDRDIQTSCSSLTDTCSYPKLTSKTSMLSTLGEEDDDNNIVYPKITSFESLSHCEIVETPKDKNKRKAPEKGRGGKGKKHKSVKEVSPSQDDRSDSDNNKDDEFEEERHDNKLNVKESDAEYSIVDPQRKATKKKQFQHDDDIYDIAPHNVHGGRVKELECENDDLKRHLQQMKQQMAFSQSCKARKKKELTQEQKQMLSEVGGVMRRTLFRSIKFPIHGWDRYSEDMNSCCGRVLSTVKLPPQADENLRRMIWDELMIKPELHSILGVCKNSMTQDMRKQHESDRGTVDYIDVSQLHEMLQNNTPHEVINSSDSRDMFVLFVLRYARYAAPKEQLKKEMRNEVLKAGASKGEHLHKCHLDFLTSSDIAYAVWQYLNSHDDWERKIKDPTKAYNHNTKWSTDKTGASMVEGYKVYDALEKWCKELQFRFTELKGMSKRDASEEDKKCYEELRVVFNKKAKSLGGGL